MLCEQELVATSQLDEIKAAFSKINAMKAVPAELQGLFEEFRRLEEDLSTGDWGRIGVLAGLLWYKLDTLIKILGDNNQELKNIGNSLKR